MCPFGRQHAVRPFGHFNVVPVVNRCQMPANRARVVGDVKIAAGPVDGARSDALLAKFVSSLPVSLNQQNLQRPCTIARAVDATEARLLSTGK